MPEGTPIHIDRRTTIKWVLAAAATAPQLKSTQWLAGAAVPAAEGVKGYGTDPDLQRIYSPGDLWPLTLTEQQRGTAAALCDVIIPSDAHSPSASAVGVVDFIDEWISAPYPRHQQDRALVLSGLRWFDDEARRRYSKLFAVLSGEEHAAMCEQICYAPEAHPSLVEVAAFFARYRDLTAAGFYTTPAGHKDLQYVGNVALANFDGPPRAILEAVGLVSAGSR
jgi:hypothetical protein